MLPVPADRAPDSVNTLIKRAQALAGLSLGELALQANVQVPEHFRREKGFTGQLLERFLGAEAGAKAQQDFPDLGIELKSIPIDPSGQPLETTYVCYAPLLGVAGIDWASSNVCNKLRHVLWVPIEGDRSIPPAERRLGTPFLWSPNADQYAILKADWEELMERVALGHVDSITARLGQALHMRPKAADGSALTDAIGQEGQRIRTRPRGFYLRTTFTAQILADQFG
ncbi:DNA mismatch repair endonuclease MutH [Aestuariibacter halophilus]|uniref:DNA mismatch repair protein MutH n=1 Tax=Fluctibacter halophilus TaxID=226011 RepID=A0ABS8GBJ8_9ALTE|nr:DNA mismatch repair endonuclease MutH [Aestuariibacter halophilus]MCC2617965.1 DNA mismatch repair endonuclease MutH [Aestuariibacter halophilus]